MSPLCRNLTLIRRLYTEEYLPRLGVRPATSAIREPPCTLAAFTRPCIEEPLDHAANSPVLAPPKTPNHASALLSFRKARRSLTAFDLPTLMGANPTTPSPGEVGTGARGHLSLAYMEVLFDQIPLADVHHFDTINSPSAASGHLSRVRRKQAPIGSNLGTLSRTTSEGIHRRKRNTSTRPPFHAPVIDNFAFGKLSTRQVQRHFHQCYHILEAGSTAIQNSPSTLRDGMEVREWALRRGFRVNNAAALSFSSMPTTISSKNGQYRRQPPHLLGPQHKPMKDRVQIRQSQEAGRAFPHAQRQAASLTRASKTHEHRGAHRNPKRSTAFLAAPIAAHQLATTSLLCRPTRGPHRLRSHNLAATKPSSQHGSTLYALLFRRKP